MMQEMKNVIYGLPVSEVYGRFLVTARRAEDKPYLVVTCPQDETFAIHFGIDILRGEISVEYGLITKPDNPLCEAVLSCFDCSISRYENSTHYFVARGQLMSTLEDFVEKLRGA